MEFAVGLIGAVIGGALVLLGDAISRHEEWRRESVRDLRRAAGDLSAAYMRVVGAVTDGREQGTARSEVAVWTRPDRLEALTSFFVQPGSDRLHDHAIRLKEATRLTMVAYHAGEAEWRKALTSHEDAVKEFEKAVRAVR
jgi:hypothetical protein